MKCRGTSFDDTKGMTMAAPMGNAREIFLAALDRPREGRDAYLDEACAGDAVLRKRVEALLRANDEPGPFLSAPEANDLEVTAAHGDAAPEVTGTLQAGDEPPTAPYPIPAAQVEGSVIAGRYKIRQEIGEGGMGSVYLAEQTQPVKRMVALKLIKAGMDSRNVLARFESERQALALMDHPNIAKVLDAGTTEQGRPFFVMELVKGIPLTDYCDQHRLDVPERLALFRQICSAVQHAHQKGIIHRDLKPTNILVESHDGKPVPKVIDFGLAKATSGMQLSEHSLFTAFGSVTGTPLYMAPEQATFNALDVDTRADIYALGVILYELLSGSTPIRRDTLKRAALDEMLRVIREDEPPTPSSRISSSEALPSLAANRHVEPSRLSRLVKGDLDWIVMKALAKERDRRYDSAIGLANDIERYTNHEPVSAGPPTARYRLGKFVRRNRGRVVAASLVLLALVGGVVGTTLGLLEARRSAVAERLAKIDAQANEKKAVAAAEGERLAKIDAQDKKVLAEANEKKALAAADEEKKAKETVEDVLGFVENKVFAAARPKGQVGGQGYDVKLIDAMTAALPAIETGFSARPLTEARLRKTIGLSFWFLGKPEIALQQFEAARSIYRRELGPDHPNTLGSMNNLANSYAALGRNAEALKLREETLALQKSKLGPDHPDTLGTMNNLANSYADLGRNVEALKLIEETLALMKAKLGPDHPGTLTSMNNLASSYYALGRNAEALKLYEETLALQKAKLGPDQPDTLQSMNNLAISYAALGRNAEALKLHEETLALQKAKLGPDHPDTLVSMYNLASSYAALGRNAEAIKLYEETLALQKSKLGPDHPDTLGTMNNLANSYADLGRNAEALKLRDETLALQKSKLGPDHPDTLNSMHNLASSYTALGRNAEALKLDEETLALRKAKLGPDHPDTLNSMNNLASSYYALGRKAEALKLLEETLALRKSKLGPDHPDTLSSMNNLASSYDDVGRKAEALKLYEETLALRQAKLGPDHPATLLSMGNLANAMMAVGRTPEALLLLETLSASNPKDTASSRMLAALQAWFGKEESYATTRKRLLAFAEKSDDPTTTRRSAQAAALRPSSDGSELEAILALGRKAVASNKGEWELLALGMAEFRNGHFAAADEALLAAAKAGKDPNVAGIATFYRAMSLFQQGKKDEAFTLADEASDEMQPLPGDETNPMAGNATPDNLILWLAYKEAKSLIGFNGPDKLASMDNLARSHAASGRHAEAIKLYEETLPLTKAKLGPDHPDTLRSMNNLALSYLAAGRTPEARTLLETEAAAHPQFAMAGLRLAALEAWSGRQEGLDANRRRLLELGKAKDDILLYPSEQTLRAFCLIPSADREALEAAVALARRVADLGKEDKFRDYFLLALGMAEFRAGHFAEADAATLAAINTHISGHAGIPETSSFYRAMSLFRQGKPDEARKLAIAATSTMKPLPAAEVNSLTGGISETHLILWLAYKEAKALIGLDAPPAATAKPDKK
jgi:serine/threonine protein kinase